MQGVTAGLLPAGNWTSGFEPGQSLRPRLINAVAVSIFDVHIPSSNLRVVAADGQDVEPVSMEELRIEQAEIHGLSIEPDDPGVGLQVWF